MTTDPQPETALALLYRHGLPEDVIDGALSLHAQELAARQRTEMRAPGRSYDASRWNRCVDMTADLITPGAEEEARLHDPVSSAVAQSAPAETALRDRIAEAMARADGWDWAAANFASLSTPATDRYRRCADAVLAVLPAADRPAEEAYRLAVSAALRLGTGAAWEAIRDRAEDLTAEVRQLTEGSRRLLEQRQEMAAERFVWQERGDRAEARVRQLEAAASVDRAALGIAQREMLSYALDLVEQRDFSRSGRLTDDDRIVLAELRRMAVEAQQQTETQAATGPGPWVVQMICCGHDDGKTEFATWQAADNFREEYIDSARIADHERAAIVRRGEPTDGQQPAAVPGGAGEEPADETREAEARQYVARQCVEYFLQSRETGGAWEGSSSSMVELDYAAERLAKRRNLVPGFEYRIAQRTTTVDVQPLPDCLGCRHWMCNGDGPCGALVDSWQRCTCPGPSAAVSQPDKEH
ncbi:hypothetical protein AB0M61_01760 [Streptomyces sp. NPDC051642]|uniref:hypothetical protein n=1 Tax=Streptomyces sp. NPDC051642 TaxID=3154646 RepID=UPI00341E44A4